MTTLNRADIHLTEEDGHPRLTDPEPPREWRATLDGHLSTGEHARITRHGWPTAAGALADLEAAIARQGWTIASDEPSTDFRRQAPPTEAEIDAARLGMLRTREFQAGFAFGIPTEARDDFLSALARAALEAARAAVPTGEEKTGA